LISGTPTQAGIFEFYLTVKYDKNPGCAKVPSDDRFILRINPATQKLTIGPEQAGVPPATVGTAFLLPMTATLSEPKTWSISEGALPPGVVLGASDGVISGTPTTAGTYTFTVRAVIDAQRTDTKALAIVVRAPLVVAPSAAPKPAEVGVPMRLELGATGGSETYVWTLSDGEMPPGVALATNGSVTSKTISGKPTLAGTYRFEVEVADTEGRKTTYAGVLTVAPRLSLGALLLRPAKVGRPFRAKLKATGGVLSRTWKVKSGVLPRGVRLDRVLGVFTGTPRKAGTYRVTVEVTDALDVKSTKTFALVVRP
jgi:large repetitive protein